MKTILSLLLIMFLALGTQTQAQPCPPSLVCNTLTAECWDVGNWNPNPVVLQHGSGTNIYFSLVWTPLAGSKSYNVTWMKGSYIDAANIDVCHFLAYYPGCGRWTNYDYSSASGWILQSVLNGGGFYDGKDNVYYAIQAVSTTNQITVSMLYKINGSQPSDGALLTASCSSYVNSFFAEPPPAPITTTPVPVKKKGNSGK